MLAKKVLFSLAEPSSCLPVTFSYMYIMDLIIFTSYYSLLFLLLLLLPFLPVSPSSAFLCYDPMSTIRVAYRSTGYKALKMFPLPTAFRL